MLDCPLDRPQQGERAVLVHINFISRIESEDLEEFRELALSAGVTPVATLIAARKRPDPKFLIGSTKADEVKALILENKADVVLVDHALTPAQERNLERHFQCRVLDRTGLILDIFAQRASTHEGRLQVELAQLQHLSTRLVRGWTHLERQKGGIGLRGPGETQLETDRRLIGIRIKQLKKRLEKVKNRRQQSRRSRQKAQVPTVSLVGYTNAGKSTLFNALTQASVYAKDQLFATLDPTFRRVELPDNVAAIFADTVGFIRQLPHDLVESFHSTLEESRQANLLLRIVDANNTRREECVEQVNSVLKEIDAEEVPQLLVFNKIDLLGQFQPRVDYDQKGLPVRVWVSAKSGQGLDLLTQAISQRLRTEVVLQWLRVPASNGKLRAKLYQHGKVRHECVQSNGDILVEVEMLEKDLMTVVANEAVEFIDNPDDTAIAYCG